MTPNVRGNRPGGGRRPAANLQASEAPLAGGPVDRGVGRSRYAEKTALVCRTTYCAHHPLVHEGLILHIFREDKPA